MTKSELIEGLKDLDDDAEVHVYCTSFDMPSGRNYAYDIYFDDKVTGKMIYGTLQTSTKLLHGAKYQSSRR